MLELGNLQALLGPEILIEEGKDPTPGHEVEQKWKGVQKELDLRPSGPKGCRSIGPLPLPCEV